MNAFSNKIPVPAWSSVTYLCVQVYINSAQKRGVPPLSLALEIIDESTDMTRIRRTPQWLGALQDRRRFLETAKSRLTPDMLATALDIIASTPNPDTRYAVISPTNVAVYLPEDDGTVTINVLFADEVQSFNLPRATSGAAAYRMFHDPLNLFSRNLLPMVQRKKVTPQEAQFDKLAEQVAVMQRQFARLSEQMAGITAENAQLRREVEELQSERLFGTETSKTVPHTREEMMQRLRDRQH